MLYDIISYYDLILHGALMGEDVRRTDTEAKKEKEGYGMRA